MVFFVDWFIELFEFLQLLDVDPAALLIEYLLGRHLDLGRLVLILLGDLLDHFEQHPEGGPLLLLLLHHHLDEFDHLGVMVDLLEFLKGQPAKIRGLQTSQLIEGDPEAVDVVLDEAVRGLQFGVLEDELELRRHVEVRARQFVVRGVVVLVGFAHPEVR